MNFWEPFVAFFDSSKQQDHKNMNGRPAWKRQTSSLTVVSDADSNSQDDTTFFLPSTSDASLKSLQVADQAALIPYLVKAWDVKVCPISKRLVRGHPIPTVQSAAKPFWQRSRRLTIEVHGVPKKGSRGVRSSLSKASSSSKLSPVHEDLRQGLLQGRTQSWKEGRNQRLQASDVVLVRFAQPMVRQVLKRHVQAALKRPRKGEHEIPSSEVSSLGMRCANEDDEDYQTIFTYRLDEITVVDQLGRFVELEIAGAVQREIRFVRERDAEAFCDALQQMKLLEHDQQTKLLKHTKQQEQQQQQPKQQTRRGR